MLANWYMLSLVFLMAIFFFCKEFKRIKFKKLTLRKIDYIYYVILSLTIFFLSPSNKNGAPVKILCDPQNFTISRDTINKEWHSLAYHELQRLRDTLSSKDITPQTISIVNDFFSNKKSANQLYNEYHDNTLINKLMQNNAQTDYEMLSTYNELLSTFNNICEEVRASQAYTYEYTPKELVNQKIVLAILLILIAYKIASVTSDIQGWTVDS